MVHIFRNYDHWYGRSCDLQIHWSDQAIGQGCDIVYFFIITCLKRSNTILGGGDVDKFLDGGGYWRI